MPLAVTAERASAVATQSTTPAEAQLRAPAAPPQPVATPDAKQPAAPARAAPIGAGADERIDAYIAAHAQAGAALAMTAVVAPAPAQVATGLATALPPSSLPADVAPSSPAPAVVPAPSRSPSVVPAPAPVISPPPPVLGAASSARVSGTLGASSATSPGAAAAPGTSPADTAAATPPAPAAASPGPSAPDASAALPVPVKAIPAAAGASADAGPLAADADLASAPAKVVAPSDPGIGEAGGAPGADKGEAATDSVHIITDLVGELDADPSDLWVRLRKGFAIPDLDDPLVRKWEAKYAEHPEYFARMIDRSRRYLYHVVNEIEARGMPLEIALLPMIESAFNPMAYSRAKASGIWQFIPSTGDTYGLPQTWWTDKRRDVVAATRGALDYLEKLHQMFADWRLALAAYNWGEGAVSRAQAANRRHGLGEDYLSLRMPDETRNYVPKLQAVKNIIANPEQFRIALGHIPNFPYFKVVAVDRKIDVKLAAELAGMPVDEFLSLNPQHNRPVIAGGDENSILLPYDRADRFIARLDLHDQPLVSWQAYRIQAGESMRSVADRLGLSEQTLRTVNGIGARSRVPVGHTLLVPVQKPTFETAASLQHAVFRPVPPSPSQVHRVRKGDTLHSVASAYGVSPSDLREWNGLAGERLALGQRLRIPGDPGSLAMPAANVSVAPAPASGGRAVVPAGSRAVAPAAGSGAAMSAKTTPPGRTASLPRAPATARVDAAAKKAAVPVAKARQAPGAASTVQAERPAKAARPVAPSNPPRRVAGRPAGA